MRGVHGGGGGGEQPSVGRTGSECGQRDDKGGAQPGVSQVMNGTDGGDNIGGHLLSAVGLINKVGWGQGGADGQNKGRRPPGSGCSSMFANGEFFFF
jgi:hypothetical protein